MSGTITCGPRHNYVPRIEQSTDDVYRQISLPYDTGIILVPLA